MTNILITGGAGFIGTSLSKKLVSSGYKIRIVDSLSAQVHGQIPEDLGWLKSKDIDFIRGSVTDRIVMEKAVEGMDCIVHLAAETGTGQSMYAISHYNAINVGGTALLFDILANDPSRRVRRIILASSRSIYGEGAYECQSCNDSSRMYPEGRNKLQLSQHLWDHTCHRCNNALIPVATLEIDPAKPASIYAATKYAQEDLVRIACKALDIDHAILRLQNVYGEGQSLNNPYTGILSIFSTRIRSNQHLPIFEDGRETRDFIHIEDVVNSFKAAIEHNGILSEVINVGTGVKTSVIDIATHLSNAFGKKPNLVITNQYRVGDIRHNFADITNLDQILSYRIQIDLPSGMERFANWVNQQPIPEDKLDIANSELTSRGLMGA